ncbi:helix-turn-helix domain-containing protein [Lentzea sp. NPDC059081]|uniref:TetR/AcrR family transcriptional regulator n=1 Tax=Lentzea sp. NPDC059081 TaxID=3346719 RepID=UPI0036AF3A71
MSDLDGVTNERTRDAARTRAVILAEARRQFAATGYSTTVRAIAAGAGVSPNLITRYFGGKDGLFLAATQVHLELAKLDGPRATLGRRLADAVVARWSGMQGEDPLLVLHRASGERPEAARALTAFLDEESLRPFTEQLLRYGLTPADAAARAAAVDALVLGVSTRRRVLADDLGDLDDLSDWLAGAVQRLVDAP